MHLDSAKIGEYYLHFIAFSSIASNVLAIIERAVNNNFPGSRFAKGVQFANDLVSGFAALNFRDKIVNGSAQKGADAKANAATTGN